MIVFMMASGQYRGTVSLLVARDKSPLLRKRTFGLPGRSVRDGQAEVLRSVDPLAEIRCMRSGLDRLIRLVCNG